MIFYQNNAGVDEDARVLIGGCSVRFVHWMDSAFAAPRTQEPAAKFVLESPVDTTLERGGLSRLYRKSLLPTANSTRRMSISSNVSV
jgi:hypothetical protein